MQRLGCSYLKTRCVTLKETRWRVDRKYKIAKKTTGFFFLATNSLNEVHCVFIEEYIITSGDFFHNRHMAI